MSSDNSFAIEVRNRLLTPTEAEVWISVRADGSTGDLSVRGRIMGPHCAYASTVEVAYPLRPLRGAPDTLGATARVLIPEPSFWDPESPFLYEDRCDLGGRASPSGGPSQPRSAALPPGPPGPALEWSAALAPWRLTAGAFGGSGTRPAP